MMSRTKLTHWNYPKRDVLENRYPEGKPPFDPFPNVTEIVNAFHCPRAIYHYLHHAENGACIPQTATGGWRSGDTFHGFIELLKSSIIESKINVASKNLVYLINQAWSLFMNSNLAKNIDKPDVFFKQYIDIWIRRKSSELFELCNGKRNYFELTVTNTKIPFATEEGGIRNYPLTGRIDEIDIEKKQIIERTLRNNTSPKDFQVWLLWKILCSIDRQHYPDYLEGIDFASFDLIVETPTTDIQVERNNPEFEKRAHECYAWIHDLTFDPKAVAEVYQDNTCSYDSKKECGLAWMCYMHKWPFPMGRGEMRRKFKDMYRALLWEKIWGYDLFQYRFLSLPSDKLEERALICRASIVPNTRNNNTFQVQVKDHLQAGLIWAKGTDDTDSFLVILGNFYIGRRFRAEIKKSRASPDLFSVKINGGRLPSLFGQPLITTTGTDFLVFEEHPTYLITNLQKDLHNLEFRGAKTPERAQADSKIQLIEAVFGSRPIKRGEGDSNEQS
jgi:hypothetical protein